MFPVLHVINYLSLEQHQPTGIVGDKYRGTRHRGVCGNIF